MSGEIAIGGVYLPALLVLAVMATVPTLLIRKLIQHWQLYRFVWHRALFDVALYLVVLGGLAALSSTFFSQVSA
ncbi:DUF1656 domain-containing protein [Sphingomonas sp. C3-2]|uniref:DUF1656 domain-containing protein n=1 Tax=Sphingomonas sp. C3-2 TaxID=3062169 RepID=UPI00294A9BDA|nr:DUF1656 domain-containing protein [Sphingomonas sp. C3-2]WOK36536.1 DUF1656 domain-containing protein [Sphingomonas sp. C3-2]